MMKAGAMPCIARLTSHQRQGSSEDPIRAIHGITPTRSPALATKFGLIVLGADFGFAFVADSSIESVAYAVHSSNIRRFARRVSL